MDAIAAGKADKITCNRFEVPTAKPKATKKAPAKKPQTPTRSQTTTRRLEMTDYPDPWGPGCKFIESGFRRVDEEDDLRGHSFFPAPQEGRAGHFGRDRLGQAEV